MRNSVCAAVCGLTLLATPARAGEVLDFYGTIVKYQPGIMVVKQVDTGTLWNVQLRNGYPRGYSDGHFRSKHDFQWGEQIHLVGIQSGSDGVIADELQPPGHQAGNMLVLAAPMEGSSEPPNFNVRGTGECFGKVEVLVEPQGLPAAPGWTVEGKADELGHFDIPIESGRAAEAPLMLTVRSLGKFYVSRSIVVQVVRTQPAPEAQTPPRAPAVK